MPALRTSQSEVVRQRLARVVRSANPMPPAASEDLLNATPPEPDTRCQSLPDPQAIRHPDQSPPEPAPEPPTIAPLRHPNVNRVAGAFGLAGATVDPGRRGVTVLAVIAGVVVVLAGGIAWWNRPRPEPVPLPRHTDTVATASPSAAGVVVAVAGKVRRPGLVTLPAGSRVADAVKAAGGTLPGTDLGLLNLARKVSDGELIVVGADPGAAGAPGGVPAGKLNLNTATPQELDGLPGVGPVLAQRILEFRDAHGGFRSVADLRQVDGIGPTRYEELKDLVTV